LQNFISLRHDDKKTHLQTNETYEATIASGYFFVFVYKHFINTSKDPSF